MGQSETRNEVGEVLKMEAVCFSETLASTYQSRQRQNPEEHHHPHRRENLKSYKYVLCYVPSNLA
jgi:endo-1,4-beta-D-glucanase Y